jgi:hypothetical protein
MKGLKIMNNYKIKKEITDKYKHYEEPCVEYALRKFVEEEDLILPTYVLVKDLDGLHEYKVFKNRCEWRRLIERYRNKSIYKTLKMHDIWLKNFFTGGIL